MYILSFWSGDLSAWLRVFYTREHKHMIFCVSKKTKKKSWFDELELFVLFCSVFFCDRRQCEWCYCWVSVSVCLRLTACLLLSGSNVLSSVRCFKMWIVTPISMLFCCFYQVYIHNTIPLISFRGLKCCNNWNINMLQLTEDSGTGGKKSSNTNITLFNEVNLNWKF